MKTKRTSHNNNNNNYIHKHINNEIHKQPYRNIQVTINKPYNNAHKNKTTKKIMTT